MLENCDTIVNFGFNFDACPMQSPFWFVHLMHQNLKGACIILTQCTRKIKHAVIDL